MEHSLAKGLQARTCGTYLDNSDGESVSETRLRLGTQEIVVFLSIPDDKKKEIAFETFNLADLIALARQAKP